MAGGQLNKKNVGKFYTRATSRAGTSIKLLITLHIFIQARLLLNINHKFLKTSNFIKETR